MDNVTSGAVPAMCRVICADAWLSPPRLYQEIASNIEFFVRFFNVKINIKHQRDFVAGLFFLSLAIAGGLLSTKYRMGSAAQMGPGYFPLLLSTGLGLLGSAIVIKSFFPTREDGSIGKFHLKPLLIVIAALALFGLALEPLGLVLSTVLLVAVSSLGSPEKKHPMEISIACVFLAAFSWAVFIKGLGLFIPVWPAMLVIGG